MIVLIIVLIIIVGVMLFVFRNQKKKITMITEQAQQEINKIRRDVQKRIEAVNQAFEKEKDELNAQHDEEIQALLQKYESKVKQAREQAKEEIESRRSALSGMNDREMLINIILALDGYGIRLNRIENSFTDEKIITYTEQLFQKHANKVEEMTGRLEYQIDDLTGRIERSLQGSDFFYRIEGIRDVLAGLVNDVEEIRIAVSDKYSYDSLAAKIEEIKESVKETEDIVCRFYQRYR